MKNVRKNGSHLIMGVLLAVAARPAAGQVTLAWTAGGDGMSFSDSFNWTPLGVPGPLDDAKFDRGLSETVMFSLSPNTARTSIENDTVTFFLGGRTYMTNGLIVGDRGSDIGRLTINGGTVSVGSGLAKIGRFAPSSGTVTVAAGAALTCLNDAVVGDEGQGTLLIQAGGAASSDIAFIGDEPASVGTATVRGSWTVTRSVIVGNSGSGGLSVLAGGVVNASADCLVADDPGATGTVSIDGPGSLASFGLPSVVGNLGTGTMNITNGGAFASPGLIIGDEFQGTVTVSGPTSRIDCPGTLSLGRLGVGALNLAAGGRVSATTVNVTVLGTLSGTGIITGGVTNAGVVRPGSPRGVLSISGGYLQTGRLEIEVGGYGVPAGHDRLAAGGLVQLGGSLVVTLTGGFNPRVGQFVIVTGGAVVGSFWSVTLPPGFFISYEATRVVISRGGPVRGQVQ